MMKRLSRFYRAAGVASLAFGVGGVALNGQPEPGVKAQYVVLPPTVEAVPAINAAGTPLPTWNGSFNYQNQTWRYTMVGTSPLTTNTTTTIEAVIIPIEINITEPGGVTATFDPRHVLPTNGNSVIRNTRDSPIFDSMEYTLGGTPVGTTQYEDAFQRANFWSKVQTNTNYHVLLGGPTVKGVHILSPPANKGVVGTPFGQSVAEVDINWLDTRLHSLLVSLNIQPNQLPIFLTYNTYLTQNGGCCIGGYHSAVTNVNGTEAYVYAGYIDEPGNFAEDVSALSHEVGEWMDDPLVTNSGNSVACGILEVGDPEEGFKNYGTFPYVLNGFTYHLQDLVFIGYFGAPNTTSIHDWLTFHKNPFGLSVCSNGG